MECRNLDITLVSVGGLKSLTKNDTYFVWRSGGKKFRTKFVVRNTGSSEIPVNFPMNFIIDEATALKGDLSLLIKFKAVKWMFFSETLGKGRVPIKDLMECITEEGKKSQLVSYPVVNQKADQPGAASLTFSYEFGKKFLYKVTKSGSKLEKSSSGFGTDFTDIAAYGGDHCSCDCDCSGGGCRLIVW